MFESSESSPHDLRTAVQGRRVLLAASTGGHLSQLRRFAHGFGVHPDSVWLTFDSAQSRSLLAGMNVRYTDYVAPRDLRRSLGAFQAARQLLATERFDHVISTGAALGAAALAAAKLAHVPSSYIESVSRLDGPSLSGRLVARLRLGATYTQHETWASERWKLHRSVLSAFRSVPRANEIVGDDLRLFVTLGTIRPYRFDSLVDAINRTGLTNQATTWQLGTTSRDDLAGAAFSMLQAGEFEKAARNADVVVTHAGVGTILQLLEWGIHPVVVPRSAKSEEHVDDHQHQIARFLRQNDLATVSSPQGLDAETIRAAANRRVVASE